MRTPEEKKKFILETLLPYKENPELCGYGGDNGSCVYEAPNGNRCAFGKHMTPQHLEMFASIDEDAKTLLSLEGVKILTEEASSMDFSKDAWNLIQRYHDIIAKKNFTNYDIYTIVNQLELSTGLELTELKF